jgi:DNA repair exonuclease SbcCD nuclease subunit
MKVGIMSDSHLGERRFRRQVGHQNMFKLQNYKCFREALVKLQDADCILLAGDLYDGPNPDVDAIIVSKELAHLKVPAFVLGGNHDFSKLAESNGYHSFDVLRDEGGKVSFVTEFGVFDLNPNIQLFCIPYGQLNAESFAKVSRLLDRSKLNILMAHGYLEVGGERNEEYGLPQVVAKNFDLVVCGHVHLPNMVGMGKVKVLTPGSLMPSAAAFNAGMQMDAKPSVWMYDTESKSLERIHLENAPSVYSIHTSNLNETLENVVNANELPPPIYSISYSGSMADVDESVYKKALHKVMNLSVSTLDGNMTQRQNDAPMVGFWDFIKRDHPCYYEEFQEIVKEAGM